MYTTSTLPGRTLCLPHLWLQRSITRTNKDNQPLSLGNTLIGNDVGIGDGGAVALAFTQNEILDKWLLSPTINHIE